MSIKVLDVRRESENWTVQCDGVFNEFEFRDCVRSANDNGFRYMVVNS